MSILIVSWNTRDKTAACLDSIDSGLNGAASRDVVVVDNGSTDGSAEMLATRTDIQLVANESNRGYAAAVNQAYAMSRGELVLLLNSDIRFTPGSLAALIAFLAETPGAAAVGPQYLNPDGSPQSHHYRLPTFAAMLANSSVVLGRVPALRRRVRSFRMLDDDFSRPRRVEQPSASCLLLRRDCLPRTWLMEERFPIYFNDVALARFLADAGRELWMTPESVVYHDHGASTRLMGSSQTRQYLGAQVRYLRGTESRPRLLLFRLVVFAEYLARLVVRHPGRMTMRDLLASIGGDPGPLPQVSGRAR